MRSLADRLILCEANGSKFCKAKHADAFDVCEKLRPQLEELQAAQSSEESFEGGVVLLTQLLGLLAAFIGESLTFQLMREIWPGAQFSDLESTNGAKYESTTQRRPSQPAEKDREQIG
jgi:hypothetical protein